MCCGIVTNSISVFNLTSKRHLCMNKSGPNLSYDYDTFRIIAYSVFIIRQWIEVILIYTANKKIIKRRENQYLLYFPEAVNTQQPWTPCANTIPSVRRVTALKSSAKMCFIDFKPSVWNTEQCLEFRTAIRKIHGYMVWVLELSTSVDVDLILGDILLTASVVSIYVGKICSV